MPRQPNKPQREWDRQKENIYKYYILQKETLAKTMELMQMNHSFVATEREYVRRLGVWQMSKNIKKSDWQIVHKRKAAHKETAIILNGQHIDPRKKQRGLSRHRQERDDSLFSILSSCSSTRGITTRSPSPGPNSRLLENNTPWFRFDHEFGCHLLCMVKEFIPQLKWNSLSNGLQSYVSPGDLSLQKARELIGQALGLGLKSNCGVKLSSDILNRLECVLPQEHGTYLPLASTEPFFLVIQIHIYLSSNSKLSLYDMSNLLSWILDKGNLPLFRGFLGRLRKVHFPTLEIFLNRLLLSAVHLRRETAVSSLLACGANPNYNNHPFQGQENSNGNKLYIMETITPLQLAVIKGNSPVCELLLEYGANASALSCAMPFSPLELAISVHHGNLSIAERILAQGVDMKTSCEDEIIKFVFGGSERDHFIIKCSKKTLLMKAITIQNIDIARLLLKDGASPNEMSYISGTALQIAIIKNDIRMVELLLESGAEVNTVDVLENSVRAYFIYRIEEYGRQTTIQLGSLSKFQDHFDNNTEWGAFLSPIQLAARQNNLLIIQCLIKQGATISFPLDYRNICDKIMIPKDSSRESTFHGYLKEISKRKYKTILHESVANGNVDLTSLLLRHGACAMINCPDGLGKTPLQAACGLERYHPWQGYRTPKLEVAQVRRHLMQLLVDSGASVNSPAGHINGRTALQAAAERGDQILVGLLIQKGADIEAAPGIRGGISTGEAAAKSGNLNLLVWLTNQNMAISHEDVYCMALYSAALNGNVWATRQCLEKRVFVNAAVSRTDKPGIKETILQASIRGGNIEVVQLLLQARADTNALVGGETALCTAVRTQDIEILDILFDYGANPNLTGTRFTPLAIASRNLWVETVQRLLQAGSDVNRLSRDPTHQLHDVASPIFWAFYQYQCESLKGTSTAQHLHDVEKIGELLLSHGANPNAGCEDQKNVLTVACEHMSYSIVEDLIEYGANVNVPDGYGVYPIQAAASNSGTDTVELLQLLLDEGADINPPVGEGCFNVFESALNFAQGSALDFVINAGVQISNRGSQLPRLIEMHELDLAVDWINDKVDVNCLAEPNYLNGDEITALQAAANIGHMGLIQLLLAHGANVNAPPGYHGATSLQFAASKGCFNIVKMLIKHGADINAPAPLNEAPWPDGTALQNAAKAGQLDIVHLLLENGGQIDTMDLRCEDAAVIAENNGHHVLARTLREYRPQRS